MALIEKINQMRKSGMSETQIIKTLREENYNPTQINEALSQSQIKAAITEPGPVIPAVPISAEAEEMEQSIMQPLAEINQQTYPEQTLQPTYPMQAEQQEYPRAYPEQPYYGEVYEQAGQAYAPQETYYQQALDIETIRDIAKQLVEEETLKIKTQIAEITKLKTDLKFQIQNIDNRLKRIEDIIQQLESAILQKIGNFGQAIGEISDELHATQESFGKLINPIIDKRRGIGKIPAEEPEEPEQKQQSSKKSQTRKMPSKQTASFEDYFR